MNRYDKREKKLLYGDIFTAESVNYYRHDIVGFVEDIIFQGKPEYYLSSQQKDLLIAIQENKRISVKSGKGIGKTATLSFAMLWFLCCFDSPKIVCTAPSYPTLKSALWPEVAKWLGVSLVKNIFSHGEERLYLIEKPKNWWAEPRTAKDKENMQGLHADNLLIVVDEASGLSQDISEALDTTLTGSNNKIVMIGNPTQVVGPFFDAFNKFSGRWITRTYSALDSPFVLPEQVSYYEEKYGKTHDLYRVNILGEFPTGSPNAFIKLSDIHASVSRSSTTHGVGEIEIGLDVARFGDDLTVLYWRHGFKVYPCKLLSKSSTVDSANLVINTVREIRKKTGFDRTIRVKVDDSGVGGGVVDILKTDRDNNLDIIPCNFGGKGNEIYQNEASTMWGKIKENLHLIALPDDSRLIEELSSRRWKLSANGKIMIESKSEYKREFKLSPDRADALCLCFANKSNTKSVIKEFDPLDDSIVKPKFDYVGGHKYASIFYSKDLYASVLYSVWDGNSLYIYDEYVGTDSLIYVVMHVNSHQPIKKIIGNSIMFGDVKDDLCGKFRKYKVNVHENYNYNEISSLDTLTGMFNTKRIKIYDKCQRLISQIRDWKMDYSRVEQERQFGLCLALCNQISDLKKIMSVRQEYIPTIRYNENDNHKDSVIDGSWMF